MWDREVTQAISRVNHKNRTGRVTRLDRRPNKHLNIYLFLEIVLARDARVFYMLHGHHSA